MSKYSFKLELNSELSKVKSVVMWILLIYFLLAMLSLFFYRDFFYSFESDRIITILVVTFLTLIILKCVNFNLTESTLRLNDATFSIALCIFLVLFFSFTSLTLSSLTGNYRDEVSARTSVTQYLSIVFSLLAIVSQRNHQSKLLMLVAFIVFSIFILNADRMSLLTFLPAFLLCYLKCGFKLKLRYFLFGGVLLTVIQSLRIGADFNIGLNSFYLLLANPRDTLFSSYLVSEVVSKCGGERSDYLLSWIVHIFSIFSEKPTYITDTYACNDIPGGGFAAGYYFMFFGDWFIILMPFLTYMFLKIPSLFSGYERSFLCLVGLCSLIRYLYYGPVALPKYILVALFVVFFLRLFIKKN